MSVINGIAAHQTQSKYTTELCLISTRDYDIAMYPEQPFHTNLPVSLTVYSLPVSTYWCFCFILLTLMLPPTQACHGTFITEEQHQILEWATADSGLSQIFSEVGKTRPALPI